MKRVFAGLLAMSAAALVHASDYGCRVLLCLSNPASNGGPQGVAECVSPINQLYRDLRKGRPFPACDLADGNDGSSYAQQVFDPYDPCPPYLLPAERGAHVIQGLLRNANGNARLQHASGPYILCGHPQMSERPADDGGSPGARACVGKLVGMLSMGSQDDSYSVSVFDKVVWQPAQNPQAIDVYINRIWHARVRW